MRSRAAVCLVALLFTAVAHARSRVADHGAGLPSPASIMWIAAHPDDEAVIAPLLAKWCRDDGARCAIVVLTRGEAGECKRSDGCLPDVATVRSAEAGSASQYFGAVSILLNLPDEGGTAHPSWDTTALATDLSRYIEAFHPEVVMTFDPRHGTSCHPAHRLTGAVVTDALRRLASPPDLYYLETVLTYSAEPFGVAFSAAIPAVRFDANTPVGSLGHPAWNAIFDDMARHASQFDTTVVEAVRNVPVADRAVYLLPATEALRLEPSVVCY